MVPCGDRGQFYFPGPAFRNIPPAAQDCQPVASWELVEPGNHETLSPPTGCGGLPVGREGRFPTMAHRKLVHDVCCQFLGGVNRHFPGLQTDDEAIRFGVALQDAANSCIPRSSRALAAGMKPMVLGSGRTGGSREKSPDFRKRMEPGIAIPLAPWRTYSWRCPTPSGRGPGRSPWNPGSLRFWWSRWAGTVGGLPRAGRDSHGNRTTRG